MPEERRLHLRCLSIALGWLLPFNVTADVRVFALPDPDPWFFDPLKISADGSTLLANWTGPVDGVPGGAGHVMVWRFGEDIRFLQVPGTTGEGFGGDLSSDGRRVVVTTAGDQPRAAYLWDQAGFTRLGLPVAGYSYSGAISRNGQFAAGTGTYLGFAQRLSTSGDPEPAQYWPGYGGQLWPRWISDDGERLVGWTVASSGWYSVFRGDRSGEYELLEQALPFAVASDGVVAGHYFDADSEGDWSRAFIWDGETFRLIPGLESEPGQAVGVAAGGLAAIGTTESSAALANWYWSEATGLLSVEAILERANGPLGSLEIERVFWLSDDGLTMAGTGYDAALERAVVWVGTIPTPGAAGGMVWTLSLVAVRRRR